MKSSAGRDRDRPRTNTHYHTRTRGEVSAGTRPSKARRLNRLPASRPREREETRESMLRT
ncbi:hypothetical protein A1O1_05708 [Capronia coronata CBS 617.96]|uniref:Uncharacterized protein n=1 Tax=Capronia coronata CBS 617.96 TaxID=1182541 RepID=W9YSV5_9EURO|nr:uncharacterized protein A1O1_05708 [Capronia coronata CBS 617.96]EXJ85344.1 hypothetical protein A1O1_05708 [Capronia coronata CBS 617.96]